MRANAPPIPTPCANPTVALTPGTDPALGRLHSPCLELAGKFFFFIFCFARRRVPGPGPVSAPLAHPSSPADPHGGSPLEHASAAAHALFAAARAALTRFCARVRAGSILLKARTEEAAPHRLRGPEDAATARRRLRLCTTPTLYPSHITHTPISIHLHPHYSILRRPSRPSSSHPSHPRRDRARGRTWALLCFGSFFVFSIK